MNILNVFKKSLAAVWRSMDHEGKIGSLEATWKSLEILDR